MYIPPRMKTLIHYDGLHRFSSSKTCRLQLKCRGYKPITKHDSSVESWFKYDEVYRLFPNRNVWLSFPIRIDRVYLVDIRVACGVSYYSILISFSMHVFRTFFWSNLSKNIKNFLACGAFNLKNTEIVY